MTARDERAVFESVQERCQIGVVVQFDASAAAPHAAAVRGSPSQRSSSLTPVTTSDEENAA